jgi:hypothetical protein
MSTTITKEIEIELDYQEVVNAVEGLSTSDQSQLIEDCELAENIKSDIADDLINFIDENCSNFEHDEAVGIIEAVIDNSGCPTSDILNRVISNLDEDIKAELNVNASESEGGEITETEKEFLRIVSKYLDEDKMKKVIAKHRGGSELVEFFLLFIAK